MPRPLAERVDALEDQMRPLQQLPGQIAALDARVASLELQFLQSRAEVKDESLTTRRELDGLREELAAVAAGLRQEIRSGDEETRRYMRVLHEDLVSRLKTIREG
jgi:hypothetical protein